MKKTKKMGPASCLTSVAMKIFFALVILVVCLLTGSNLAVTGATTPQPLKVEFVSPKEGETVHGDITIEAKVNRPDAVEYCEFYIQEPGARDRYGWKDYSPPYFWGGDGQTLDTTMFSDGPASAVVFCQSKDMGSAKFGHRVYFFVNNGKTSVKILSPQDESVVAGRIVIRFTIKDTKDTKDTKGILTEAGIRTAYLYVDGGYYQLIENPHEIVWDTCLLQSGLHSITVSAVDNQGLVNSHTVVVRVKNTED